MSNPPEVIMITSRSTSRSGWARRTGLLLGGWLALVGLSALASACSSGNPQAVGNGGGGHNGNGAEGGLSCLKDEPGCECKHEGAVIQCGVAADNDGGEKGPVKCAMGGEICTGGRWSACQTNSNDPALQSSAGLKLITGIKTKGLTNPGVACSNDPCDPYCMQYPDNANGVDAGDGGVSNLGCNDASVLTVVTTGNPDASTAPASVLKDAGLADGEGYIFIDLPPNSTATRQFLTPQASIKNADIYFLIDDTSSMGAAASNLAAALTNTTNGIITGIKASLPQPTMANPGVGTYFGVGRFEDYYQAPYVLPGPDAQSSGCGGEAHIVGCDNWYNLPFQHLLSMQDDIGTNGPGGTCGALGCTAASVSWLTIDAFNSLSPSSQTYARSGGDIPEASTAALWMLASGNGTYSTGGVGNVSGPVTVNYPGGTNQGQTWWQVPRANNYWLGVPTGVNGTGSASTPNNVVTTGYSAPGVDLAGVPCTGSSGYPCFRAGSTPVIVMLSDAPGHEGPGGQYPHVDEIYSAALGSSPHLSGANPWPVQPAATPTWPSGGCPTGYGGTIGTGTSSKDPCQLTTDPSGDDGLSFSTALTLPTGTDSLPIPGVYYGIVKGAGTPRAPGTSSAVDWWSGSGVGGGVFNLASFGSTVTTFIPGYPQRSSLRDCQAADDAFECTPGVPVSSPSPTCYSNVAGGMIPVVTTGLSAGTSMYANPIVAAAAPVTNVPPTGALLTQSLTPPYVPPGGAQSLPAPSTATASTPFATTYTLSGAYTEALSSTNTTHPYATTPVDAYSGLTTHTLVSFFKISDINGNYAISPTIPLTAGEEITNVQVTIDGASQGVNMGVTVAATGLTTSSAPATSLGATSTTTGTYYAGAGGATIAITANQNATPAAPSTSTNYIELQITYQIQTPSTCATSLIYSATGAAAECPTCAAQWPYNAAVNACYGPACGGAFPTQGTGASNSGTCYAACPTVYSGYTFNASAITFSSVAGTCSYGCPTTFPSGPVSSGGNSTCYACATGTWEGVGAPTKCLLGCGGAYPNTGSGGATCYGACSAAGSMWCSATGAGCTAANECNYTCPAEYPGYVAGTGANPATTCYECGAQTPATTLDQNNAPPTCDYCTVASLGKLDTKLSPYKCDTCAGPTAPVASTSPLSSTYNYQCAATTPACGAGYTQSGGTCAKTNACINPTGQGYTATGAGLAPYTNTASTTYVLVGNPGPVTGASGGTQPGTCSVTRTVVSTVATQGPFTASSCPVGTVSSTAMSATQCSTGAQGATCVLTTGASCTALNEGTGGIECQGPGTSGTPTCTMPTGIHGGDGYFGNDAIYTFTVPSGMGWQSRYYYHFALLRGGPDSTTGNASGTDTWVTGGAPGTAGTIAANSPQPKPFLYIKSDPTTTINTPGITDSSYPYAIPSSAGASGANANGAVVDCNVSAQLSLGNASNPLTDYVVSEIDGYLPPGKYYLVVDNAAPSSYTTNLPSFQYWLQVGGFDDVPLNGTTPVSLTQPSYGQMIGQLKSLQAQFVGVENSGLSCFSNETSAYNASVHFNAATQNYAQYETRDYMEKIAYDLGSEDPNTLHPYVVPVQKDGTACNPTCPQALAAQAAGSTCGATCQAACVAWGAATCASQYPNAPYYDPATQGCTKGCTTNADCPLNTPNCQAGTPNICTSACAGGVAGLSCAVASAVANLTSNLKQNVYLRPIGVNAGSSYSAPGATCTPTMAPSPASAQCTGTSTGGIDCYGGTCTTTCMTAADCGSGMCEPSTVPGDLNKYCISPAVFVQSVQAVSTPTPVTGSQTVCGIHPGAVPCGMDSQCPPGLPTCLTSGPGVSTCGINDTGPDTVVPQPSYYNPGDPPQDNDGMFNECSPGAQVLFNVTFTMPYQRSANAQQYEFDLGIYAGAGIVGRTRVILENPALAVADFYRYYDGNAVCGSGTHVVWGNFSYKAICPSDGVGDYSQIRFCATASTSAEAGFNQDPSTAQDGANGCAPGEVLLGVATANTNPASTSATLGTINTCPPSGASGMGYSCAPVAPTSATPAGAWAACNAAATTPACAAVAAPGWASGCAWNPQLGFNVGTILQASGLADDAGLASDQYLKIRMEFDPSTPGDVVAPFLYSWNLDVDCVPSE